MNIKMPTGEIIQSSHEGNLDIPLLPNEATHAHVAPKLDGHLISIGQLCDAGCTAFFDAKTVRIMYDEQVILEGFRDAHTQLYMLRISNDSDLKPAVTTQAITA